MDSAKAKFTPSFKGKIFIWGAKKCPPYKNVFKDHVGSQDHVGGLVWAGESDRMPFIDRTEYYNFSW